MINKIFTRAVDRIGIWATVQAIMTICVGLMAVGVLVQLAIGAEAPAEIPAHAVQRDIDANAVNSLFNEQNNPVRIPYRSAVFKPAQGLQNRPVSDDTVRRIREQLQLQCVLEMNGQPVAYINITGMGLRRCKVGDNVGQLFTVLDINLDNRTVDISIIDHRVTLDM